MGRIEPTSWCQESWRKRAGESAGWYFSNDRGLGVNKVLNFPPLLMQPQELDIFGSMQSFACFYLNYTNRPSRKFGLDVSGTGIYTNASAWCNHTLPQPVTPGSDAIGLLDNIFLICGNSMERNTRQSYRRSLYFRAINYVSLISRKLAIFA